jgi:hypothetical protein
MGIPQSFYIRPILLHTMSNIELAKTNKLQDYENLDAFDKEIVRRVCHKLIHKVVSDEAMDRIEQAAEQKELFILPESKNPIQGMMDRMLISYAHSQPHALAQWFLELRQHVMELLYDQDIVEDLEYEVEEEIRREEASDGDSF